MPSMNQSFRVFAAAWLLAPCSPAAELADTGTFLETDCFECHNSDSQNSGERPASPSQAAAIWIGEETH
jgi:hypothetical protein